MKVLVAGLGSIGLRHARNFRALAVDEVMGMDPDEGRRAAFAAEIGGTCFASLDQALAARPDLVAVCSPNRFHVAQAQACATAGVALLVEKPLGAALEGVEDLLAMIGERGLFAHMGSNWKFYPAFQRLKQIIDDGVIGPVVAAQVLAGQWLPDWHPNRDYRTEYSARRDLGGGAILDTHEVDYLSWLLGDVAEIRAMHAHSGLLQSDTEDVAALLLRFAGGTIASLSTDYIQRVGRRRYNLAGGLGSVEWDVGSPLRLYLAETKAWQDVPGTLETDYNQMYLRQAEHCLRGARGEEAPVTPLAEAARILAVQLAAKGQP